MSSLLVDKRVGDLRLRGFSLAGEETCIVLPELNLCFDVGRSPREVVSIDYVCLSHGHMDHAAGVAYYFSQRCFVGNSPGCVLTHPGLVGPLARLMEVWAEIEGHYSENRVVALPPGEEFDVRRGLTVRSFEVNHGGPCLGFAAVEHRHKLRPEYAGRTGPQLVELKQQGVQIEYRLEVPVAAFCGDTMAGDYLDLDIVRNAQVLFLECTFYEREHVVRARAGRHMHVHDLPAVMERLRCPHIVLIHRTRRTGVAQAKWILGQVLGQEDLERTIFLMDRPRFRRKGRDSTSVPVADDPA